MSVKITFSGRQFSVQGSESVLECLEREGVELPSSCRAGVCRSCMVRAAQGQVPAESQAGLKDTLREKGLFLACLCRGATEDLVIELPGADAGLVSAVLREKRLLSSDIVLLRFVCKKEFIFRPGQFVNLSRHDGLTRSYSIANLPEDGFLEFHVRKVPNGQMSRWLYEDAHVGEEFQICGPNGDCFYTGSDLYQPLLLIGTGTGLAPLIGITRHALSAGHKGPITLLHGGRRVSDLYLHQALLELEQQHPNFIYRPSALDNHGDQRIIHARIDEDVRTFTNLKNHQVFLCGDPKLIKTLAEIVYKAGAELDDIHVDSFVSAPVPQTQASEPVSREPKVRAKLLNSVANRQWIQHLRFSLQALVVAGFLLQGILYYNTSFKPLGNLLPFVAYESLGNMVVSSALLVWASIFVLVMIFGRFVCGWLCPFGFFQDAGQKLLTALGVKLPKPTQQSRIARYVLMALVASQFIILPLLASPVKIWQWDLHFREPWMLGFPFYFSLFLLDLLLVFIVMGIVLPLLFGPRPYCKLVCETGMLLDQSSKSSLGRIRRNDGFDRDTCLNCLKCSHVCPQGIQVQEEVHLFDMVANTNCISCLQCVTECPNNTIVFSLKSRWSDTPKIAGYLATLQAHPGNKVRFLFTGVGVVLGAYLGLILVPPSYFHTYLLFASLGGVAGWLLWRMMQTLLGKDPADEESQQALSRAEYEVHHRILPLTTDEKMNRPKTPTHTHKTLFAVGVGSLAVIAVCVYSIMLLTPPRIADIKNIAREHRTPELRAAAGWLHFGVPPVAAVKELSGFYDGFARRLTRQLGLRVKLLSGRSYAEIAQGIEQGTLDFAFLPPMAYLKLQAQNPQAFSPLLQMMLDGKKSYSGVIVAHPNGPKSLGELRGKRIALTQFDSLSGYIAPMLLMKEVGLSPLDLGERVMAGNHSNVLALLDAGEVQAAATHPQAVVAFKRKYPKFQFVVLAEKKGLPADMLVVNSRVQLPIRQRMVEKIQALFNEVGKSRIKGFGRQGITGMGAPDWKGYENFKHWTQSTRMQY